MEFRVTHDPGGGLKGGKGYTRGEQAWYPLIVNSALIISQMQSSTLMCLSAISRLFRDKRQYLHAHFIQHGCCKMCTAVYYVTKIQLFDLLL